MFDFACEYHNTKFLHSVFYSFLIVTSCITVNILFNPISIHYIKIVEQTYNEKPSIAEC